MYNFENKEIALTHLAHRSKQPARMTDRVVEIPHHVTLIIKIM